MIPETPAEEKLDGDGSGTPSPASADSGPTPAPGSDDADSAAESDDGEPDTAEAKRPEFPPEEPPATSDRPASMLDPLESTATNTMPSDSGHRKLSDEQTKTQTEPAVLKAKRSSIKPAPGLATGKGPPRPSGKSSGRPDLSLGRERKPLAPPEADTERQLAKRADPPESDSAPSAAAPSAAAPSVAPPQGSSRPPAVRRPDAMAATEPDSTAATVPYVVEHDDPLTDEDGPTLIAYRAKKSEPPPDESTLVQVAAPATPLPPAVQLSPGPGGGEQQHEPQHIPPQHLLSPLNASHLAQHFAEREAAVEAALAAASGMGEDAGNRAERYDRMATIGSVAALGVGMFMGALCGYFAAGEAAGGNAGMASAYASLTVLTTIAIFVAGVASLQRSLEMKLAMSAMSGLMLLFTFVRLLTVLL